MTIYSPTNIQTEQQNDFVGVQNLSTTFKHNFEAQKQLFAQEIRVHYNLREPKGNKPTMVFLVVYINKKQIRISTGCKVYPKQWNSTRAITGITLTKLDNCNNRICQSLAQCFNGISNNRLSNIQSFDNASLFHISNPLFCSPLASNL